MQGYCSHGIVAHNKVSQANGAVSHAWACCDCGMRFMPDARLPEFAPEPSWLHKKLASCVEHEREACAKICRSEAERALWNFQNDLQQNESFWNGAEQMASSCERLIKGRVVR